MNPLFKFFVSLMVLFVFVRFSYAKPDNGTLTREKKAIQQARARLEPQLDSMGLKWGAPVFLRVFKDSKTLEVWIQKDDRFVRFKDYQICYFSGNLGPKKRRGDGQAPEGFYSIGRQSLNPNSAYHLSMNVGYPNAYDRAHGRTGSHIMIHGDCVSIGCLAMTDAGIEDIYALVEASLVKPDSRVQVHIFPFRLSPWNLLRHIRFSHFSFWQELRPGYSRFEETQLPPQVEVVNGRYVIK